MKPNAHMNGQGCPLCGKERTHESHRYNNETFILKASNKHNNFYSYNKTNYINSKDKVVITCPHHGDFTQTPAEHLRGFGCMECGRDKTLKARKSDSNTFIQKSILKHGTLYSYNNVKYINSSTKVIITCPEHGDFKQAPNSHLMGQGCPECSCLGSIG